MLFLPNRCLSSTFNVFNVSDVNNYSQKYVKLNREFSSYFPLVFLFPTDSIFRPQIAQQLFSSVAVSGWGVKTESKSFHCTFCNKAQQNKAKTFGHQQPDHQPPAALSNHPDADLGRVRVSHHHQEQKVSGKTSRVQLRGNQLLLLLCLRSHTGLSEIERWVDFQNSFCRFSSWLLSSQDPSPFTLPLIRNTKNTGKAQSSSNCKPS